MTKSTKTKAKKAKLPALAFPKPLYGKDPLRDDLRKWLIQWHETHAYARLTTKDRNFTLCDLTLASLAPFMVEMLAPRTNGSKAAAEVLAERYRCWITDDKDAADEWDHWVNGFDVNDYRETDNGLIVIGGLPEFKRRKAA